MAKREKELREEREKKLQEELDIKIKDWKLLHIMHKEMGLRYKKINNISWQANSPKNLILRHQFAMAFYQLDLQKKTVINIDKTWLGMSDFTLISWALAGR